MRTLRHPRMLVVSLLLGAACRGTAPSPAPTADSDAAAVAPSEESPMPGPKLTLQPPATLPAQAAKAFFSLSQMRFVVGDAPPPGLHVAGTVEQGAFVPTGKVEGEHLTVMGQGQPGWVELGDGSFHGAMEGRPPFAPYLQGTLYDDVGFVPSNPSIKR